MEPPRGPTPGSCLERSPTPSATETSRAAVADRLIAAFDELRSIVGDEADGALWNAFESADTVVREWDRLRERSEAHATAFRRATEQELAAAGRAHKVIDLVTEIVRVMHPGTENIPAVQQARPPTEPPERLVEVTMFGQFSITIDGRPITRWNGTRGTAVLQYLLLHRRATVGRDVLIEAVWPDLGAEDGRRRLHQAVYSARHALDEVAPGIVAIEFVGSGYQLRIDEAYRLVTDIEMFESLLDQATKLARTGDDEGAARALTAAEATYVGGLLADSPSAEWSLADSERLRLRYISAANQLGERLLADSEAQHALAVFTRVSSADPWNEESTRGAMRAYHLLGQDSIARQVYASCADRLDRELGVRPSAESTRLLAELTA